MADGTRTSFTASPSALGDGDVLTIANELLDVAPRWELLARCLKLSRSDITNIKTRYGEDVNQALVEVISRWIATNAHVMWSDLVQTLRQPILNEEWCASQIEDKFCVHRPAPLLKSVSSPPTLDHDPSVAVKVQSKAVRAIGQSDSQTSPCDSIGSPSSPSKLFFRDDQMESSYISYGCGECQPKTFNMKMCLNPLETDCRFPYVNTKDLSDGEREILECRLKDAFLSINREYAKFTYSLRKSLERCNITPKELADVLMDVRGCLPLAKNSKYSSLLEDRYGELRRAEDIARVFQILRDYSSFFNYDLIAFIVEMLGTEEDQQNLTSYQEKFAAYCKRHVFECPFYSGKSSKLTSFTLKVDQRMTVGESGIFTAESLLQFKSKVAEVFDITRYSLKLCSIQEGCLEILFQTPSHIMEIMLSRVDGKQLNLRSLGIQKMWYGDKEVFPIISPTLETQNVSQKPMSYIPMKRSHSFPSRSPVCVWYWLSGSCTYGDKCSFSHNVNPHKSPAIGSILVPEFCQISDEMILTIKPLGRSQNMKSYVVVHEERKIIAEDMATLEYAQKKILQKLQSVSAKPGHSVTRLNYTYFHPEGVEQAQLYEFRRRRNRRLVLHEVHKVFKMTYP